MIAKLAPDVPRLMNARWNCCLSKMTRKRCCREHKYIAIADAVDAATALGMALADRKEGATLTPLRSADEIIQSKSNM